MQCYDIRETPNGISFISSFVNIEKFLKSGKGKYKQHDNPITLIHFLSTSVENMKKNGNKVRNVLLCISKHTYT